MSSVRAQSNPHMCLKSPQIREDWWSTEINVSDWDPAQSARAVTQDAWPLRLLLLSFHESIEFPVCCVFPKLDFRTVTMLPIYRNHACNKASSCFRKWSVKYVNSLSDCWQVCSLCMCVCVEFIALLLGQSFPGTWTYIWSSQSKVSRWGVRCWSI